VGTVGRGPDSLDEREPKLDLLRVTQVRDCLWHAEEGSPRRRPSLTGAAADEPPHKTQQQPALRQEQVA
jgi:hypothetical protein